MYHSVNQLSNSRLFPWECYDIAYKTILFVVWNDYIYAVLPVHISKVIHACFHTEDISERTVAVLFFIILQCKLKILSTQESYQILLTFCYKMCFWDQGQFDFFISLQLSDFFKYGLWMHSFIRVGLLHLPCLKLCIISHKIFSVYSDWIRKFLTS